MPVCVYLNAFLIENQAVCVSACVMADKTDYKLICEPLNEPVVEFDTCRRDPAYMHGYTHMQLSVLGHSVFVLNVYFLSGH